MLSFVVIKYSTDGVNKEFPVHISHDNNLAIDKVVKLALEEFHLKFKNDENQTIEEFIIKSTEPALQ